MRAVLLLATASVIALAGCEAAFDIELPPIELAEPQSPGSPPEVWVRTFGGVAPDIATGVALLPGGVPVVSGAFGGSPIDYDGESIQTGGAGSDAFLAQLNPDFGTFSILRIVATPELEQAQSLAPHPEGGFVTGGIFASAELDLGCDTPLAGGGALSGFLAWHSPELGCIAQTAVVPTGAGEVAFAFVAVDDAGVVHATGRRRTAGSNDDVLLIRHDFVANTTVETTIAGFPGPQRGNALAIDGDETLVAGVFAQSLVLGSASFASRGAQDCFLARFDASGAPVSALQFGGPQNEQAFGLELAADGESLFVGGRFGGTSTFGEFTLNADGSSDGFVARVASDLSGFDWVVPISGPDADEVLGLAVGPDGDVYVAGGIIGVDRSSLQQTVDAYVARLRAEDGAIVWAYTFGGPGKDQPEALAVDGDSLFVVGQIGSDAQLTYVESPDVRGSQDAFLLRLPASGPASSTE